MKKKMLLIISIMIIAIAVIFVDKLSLANNNIEDGFNDLGQIRHVNTLSMMLEQNAGAGDYELETRSTWPTKDDGYVFNETLSKCENGSKLSWDEENNVILMVGNTSDKCYVYFDVYNPPSLIADVCSSGDNLAGCVKTLYQESNPDITNVYYHNSSLTNGAGDNSYRYAGASELVNNFVCFGSDEETCPDDNLYRIIGVFGNQVKLIKWDYATSILLGTNGDYSTTCESNEYCNRDFADSTYRGSNTAINIGAYWWNKSGSAYGWNDRDDSKLNIVNLNTNFITNIGTTWAAKIVTTTWKVGGNTLTNIWDTKAATAYTNECVSPAESTTETKKIGLMYTSDYGFAASPSAWTTVLSSYIDSSIISVNWIYMGLDEWTVVRESDFNNSAFHINSDGYLVPEGVDSSRGALGIRPVFYLNDNVTYVSGLGTKGNPVIID